MTAIKLFLNSIISTLTSVGSLVVFAILYALLLAAFFRFIWIREATLTQVFFTYAFMFLIPALSMPCGFTASGLPVGLQMVAAPRGEASLLAGARVLEDILGVRDTTPIDPRPAPQ